MAELQFPNIVGQYQQGYALGRQQLADKLAGQAFGAQGQERQSLLGQLAGVNPQAAMAMDARFQQQDALAQQQTQAQQADHQKKLAGAANFVLSAYKSGDPARLQGAWNAVRPYLAQLSGKEPPAQFDPAMLPKMYEILGQNGGEVAQPKYMNVGKGTVFDETAGKVAYQAPQQPTGELATLRAMQQDPSLLDTYRKAHPTSSGGGMGRAPSGYRFTADGSLEAIPGGPADASGTGQGLTQDAVDNAAWSYIGSGKLPPIGRGKEGVAQRTAIMNHAAKIAKQAGISPAELQTVPGRNKALQASLTNLQKTSDVMEKSEQGFLNNTQVAMDLSSKVDRTGSPVVNKWILGGRAAMGDPDVAALDTAINAMAVDYARIMSGATGAGGTPISTAEEAKSLIKKELSHKSLQAVVAVLENDIRGQQQAVHAQRGKILGAMQALHDSSAPSEPTPQQAPATSRPRATNPQTGETVELVNGQWVSVNG